MIQEDLIIACVDQVSPAVFGSIITTITMAVSNLNFVTQVLTTMVHSLSSVAIPGKKNIGYSSKGKTTSITMMKLKNVK